jgi:hypothetical protein
MGIDRIELTKREFTVRQYIDSQLQKEGIFCYPEFSVKEFPEIGAMIYQIRGFIYGRHVGKKRIEYPRDWWEAFKLRWMQWFPQIKIRYTVIEIDIDAEYPSFNYCIKDYEPVIITTINTKKGETRL